VEHFPSPWREYAHQALRKKHDGKHGLHVLSGLEQDESACHVNDPHQDRAHFFHPSEQAHQALVDENHCKGTRKAVDYLEKVIGRGKIHDPHQLQHDRHGDYLQPPVKKNKK
jgi:hypothetical protein